MWGWGQSGGTRCCGRGQNFDKTAVSDGQCRIPSPQDTGQSKKHLQKQTDPTSLSQGAPQETIPANSHQTHIRVLDYLLPLSLTF